MSDKVIIGLAGKAGSGKDSAAAGLTDECGFLKLSFAGALKDAVALIYGWDRGLLDNQDFKATTCPFWGITPREVLQLFGTDACRNHLRQDIWVKALQRKVESYAQNVVITDVRFPNEADAIHDWGGKVIQVVREGHAGLAGSQAAHSSETAMDNYGGWDATISAADGDLPGLREALMGEVYRARTC